MSGHETRLWEAVRPHLAEMKLDPRRVENILETGCPDVNYTYGWIELKHVERWPARRSTLVHPGLRPEQAAWLTKRWSCGGLTWVLVRVEKQLFLFSGWDALRLRQGFDRDTFETTAVWHTEESGRLALWLKADLLRWLTEETLSMEPGQRARFHRLRTMTTTAQIAKELGWLPADVLAAEQGTGFATDDLLAYWEC